MFGEIIIPCLEPGLTEAEFTAAYNYAMAIGKSFEDRKVSDRIAVAAALLVLGGALDGGIDVRFVDDTKNILGME